MVKISGYTVIRNGKLMGYPVVQSIRSLLPLVDEMVIGVGQSEDDTKALIESIGDPKIKIFDSHWDTTNTKGGTVLSDKSNEALAKCENDWCFYLQADELVHEEDLPKIRQAIEAYDSDPQVQGLVFDYVHFYGSYHTIATSKQWYRREVRVVRKSSGAQSFRDAQGFRLGKTNKSLKVKRSGGRIFHYGWVKPPEVMGRKARMLDFWWHGERENRDNEFSYDNQYGLQEFTKTHPKVMLELVEKQDWDFTPKRTFRDWQLKDIRYFFCEWMEKLFDHRSGEHRCFRLLK